GQPQAPPGDQLLSWHPPSARTSCARSAHLHQCPHPQGRPQDSWCPTQRQRQNRQSLIFIMADETPSTPKTPDEEPKSVQEETPQATAPAEAPKKPKAPTAAKPAADKVKADAEAPEAAETVKPVADEAKAPEAAAAPETAKPAADAAPAKEAKPKAT